MSNKIHWFMCMRNGAGSAGSTRHFRTTHYPESLSGLTKPLTPNAKKGRTRSITTLTNVSRASLHKAPEPDIPYLPHEQQFSQRSHPFHNAPTDEGLAKKSRHLSFFGNNFLMPDSDFETFLGQQERFVNKHLGVKVDSADYEQMLKAVGVQSLDELIERTVPDTIKISPKAEVDYHQATGPGLSEFGAINLLEEVALRNVQATNYLGQGWYPCETPSVIANNVLRNPAWNTAYTPYQAEISQGRLESLFNFQTMIVELTGLELANASLLDEATACAEAMSLCFTVAKNKKKTFLIDDKCHPQNIKVMQTRAALKGFNTKVIPRSQFDFSGKDVAGCIVQYPDTEGKVHDYAQIVEDAHASKALVAVACDPLALTVMKAPGEFGADIAVGTTQRFGIPLWLGGPHAAFFSTKDKYKRSIPGRIIGKTIDSNGKECYRLALQTREQHIKRDKATSNVCTAQALLANGSAFYAIYHGPEGLKRRAKHIHLVTKILAQGIKTAGHIVEHDSFFDTIKVTVAGSRSHILDNAAKQRINLRKINDGASISISLNDITSHKNVMDLLYLFGCESNPEELYDRHYENINLDFEGSLKRVDENFMAQKIFNSCHSEQTFSRYCRELELKDLSLVDSMIPLGSCTMKLNSSTSLDSMGNSNLANIHPLQPEDQIKGWSDLLRDLENMLCETCGFDAFFLQPNSGAQGELAGLATIRSYHESNGEGDTRKIILIPTSAHGTNPASASLCGYTIKPIKVLPDGAVDMDDLEKLVGKFGQRVAGCMITYPSTYGVFDANIREICEKVHEVGGQIYLDGANMNAQLGLCRPGDYGADVSHLNLHKTFSGPHGGGGPGAGPIGVKAHLIDHLPDNALRPMRTDNSPAKTQGALAGTDYGSPLVLAISWMWMKMLGGEGMKDSSKIAILNANYMRSRLENHYNVLFTGENGFNAHEFIIDLRPYKSNNIEALDVCKRLQDFGLHAGTMSWPIANTLMFEPTESESKQDIDNYCNALIQIKKEIEMVQTGEYDPENNPLKNAPHTMELVNGDTWDKPYSRETAAYPLEFVRAKKTWPRVGRVDDLYGDTNLICSCDGMENYK